MSSVSKGTGETWDGQSFGLPPSAEGTDLLDRYASNSSPQISRHDACHSPREYRFYRRGVVWDVTRLPRLRRCGRVVIGQHGVGVRRTAAGVVGLAGLETCGSVWACPVCNAKIMARRALEIGAAVTAWEAAAGKVGFLTFTMRHSTADSLADLWDALAYAWGKVTSGKAWRRDKERFGVAGWLRAVECTVTWDNGWHVHVHALAMLDGSQRGRDLAALHARMFGRWERALVRKGLEAPLMIGQDARLIKGGAHEALGLYLTKAQDRDTIGLEMVHTQAKKGRHGSASMTPWELLTVIDTGEDEGTVLRALDLWHEWEAGSKGRRQIAWSKGLRDLVGLGTEKQDEDVAAEVVGDESDTVVYITRDGWKRLRQHPVLIGQMLDVLAEQGDGALRLWLRRWQIEHEEV